MTAREQVLALLQRSVDMTKSELGMETGFSDSQVGKVVNELVAEGLVVRVRKEGRSWVYGVPTTDLISALEPSVGGSK